MCHKGTNIFVLAKPSSNRWDNIPIMCAASCASIDSKLAVGLYVDFAYSLLALPARDAGVSL
jgi:hypothetical protein